MKVVFDKSFHKSILKIQSQPIKSKITLIISSVEAANKINDIPHIKKMEGFKSYYRIRIGDYRIGIELEPNNTVRFILVAHRKDIYSLFP
ncbi:hypothetical protein CAP35_13530 [Chitinophagaceae bacterium IBVUCB1]|nr:hypothetical protein CAP35_13530 [Chitinophagaceae bacterium IBVUCB1]